MIRTAVDWDMVLVFLGLFPPRVREDPPQR
jgi:hypothetical protein